MVGVKGLDTTARATLEVAHRFQGVFVGECPLRETLSPVRAAVIKHERRLSVRENGSSEAELCRSIR